ncbi:hypothetical protein [Streptomyces sp. RK75]|uniref:hypothetical protein n=1 Tax=Streptomyces sp. RK75 TaxID=2824895 RepID=UPI001B374F0D|nr:hypothetical protein [Streptomyces sp. RK75]MBQ0862316.1 hypothetical protein [Streptomyces sp. RK75]
MAPTRPRHRPGPGQDGVHRGRQGAGGGRSPRRLSLPPPRTDQVRLPGGQFAQRLGGDPWPGSTAAYARLLGGFAEDFGIAYRPGDDTATELSGALLLPVLDDFHEHECRTVARVRDFDLAGLVEGAPAEQLRGAVAAQLARLAAETHLDTYAEVPQTLERIRSQETVRLVPDGPLDLRMRTLAAEVRAARQSVQPAWRDAAGPVPQQDLDAWAARQGAAHALRAFIQLTVPVAAQKVLHRRMSVHWRAELAADPEAA